MRQVEELGQNNEPYYGIGPGDSGSIEWGGAIQGDWAYYRKGHPGNAMIIIDSDDLP